MPEALVAEREELLRRRALLGQALAMLPAREKDILMERRLREEPTTLAGLSRRHNICAERVRQLERAAYEKVRNTMLQASMEPYPNRRTVPSRPPAGSRLSSLVTTNPLLTRRDR